MGKGAMEGSESDGPHYLLSDRAIAQVNRLVFRFDDVGGPYDPNLRQELFWAWWIIGWLCAAIALTLVATWLLPFAPPLSGAVLAGPWIGLGLTQARRLRDERRGSEGPTDAPPPAA